MKHEDCVVFDLDDVLIDTESNLEWLNRAFCKTLEKYKIKNSEENLSKINSKNLHIFDKICEEFKIKKEKLWKTRNDYYIKEKIKAMKNREIAPFKDVESIYKLKDKYCLAIISDSPQETVEFFVKEFGFKKLFKCVIGRGSKFEDLQKLKPSSFPYKKLSENITCKKAIYIGHNKKDREFADYNNMDYLHLDRNNSGQFRSLNRVVEYLLS